MKTADAHNATFRRFARGPKHGTTYANKKRKCMNQCTVSFVDTSGIRSQLEIQVRSAVTHTLAMKKLKDWADLAVGSPRDVILKGRMKRVLARESARHN